jgi:hypothetical protein
MFVALAFVMPWTADCQPVPADVEGLRLAQLTDPPGEGSLAIDINSTPSKAERTVL